MSEIRYHYAAFLPQDNTKCPICGREQMQHVKRCGKAAARICEEHCQSCKEYDSTLSIGICRFNDKAQLVEEAKRVSEAARKKLKLRNIQMTFNKEKREYIVFQAWQDDDGIYDVFKEADAYSAWDSFLTKAEKSGRFEIKTALKEHRKPELDAELRGVKLWRSDGGVWYVSREDKPEDIASETDALEAWVRFLTVVDILVRKSIAKTVKNF